METIMVDTLDSLKAFLQTLPSTTQSISPLYIDLEGNDLSRHGTISLMTILIPSTSKVYLIDIHTLGAAAFTTSSEPKNVTLQQILESKNVEKVFFDVRNDSDALFSLFGIRLEGINDLQLMELGARRRSKTLVSGLAWCIEQNSHLSAEEKATWRASKQEGNRLFDPAKGGSYAVFDQRPLPDEILKYSVQDVVHMPGLFRIYSGRLSAWWWERVREETVARVALSQSAGFDGKGRHMDLGPSVWQVGNRR